MLTRHSALNERRMIDWLRQNEDEQRIAPTYHEIQARFDFDTIESARTLIAQLADAGMIRCRPAGEGRFTYQILRLSRAAPLQMARPRSRDVGDDAVEEPDDAQDAKDIERCMAKIKRTLGKRKTAMSIVPTLRPKPVSTNTPGVSVPARKAHSAASSGAATRIEDRTPPQMPQRPEVETVEAQRGGHPNGQSRPASVDQGPTPATPPAQVAEVKSAPVVAPPQRVEAPQPSRQVNIKVPGDAFAALSEEAARRRLPISTVAKEIFLRSQNNAPAKPLPKPRIPAIVMRAYLSDGRPFDQFMQDALLLGVEAMAQFREAAE
jgi:hypothetical protein